MKVALLIVTVPADAADVVADRWWQLGVRGVVERDLDDGRVELSTAVGDGPAAIERAVATFDAGWEWRVDEHTDTDAAADAAGWRAFARPVHCRADLVVVPAWVDHEPVDGVTVLRIEPGGAFGLGDHPTTRSSLRALADELDRRAAAGRPAAAMLDVGCGTGALAIYAAVREVPVVRAIDLADAAVAATLDNAGRNHVAGRIDVDTTPIGELAGPADRFDVVVANILAPTLVSMAADLRRLLADDGTLIVSGVLSDGHGHGHRHVLDALAPLRARATIDDDGWATITLVA